MCRLCRSVALRSVKKEAKKRTEGERKRKGQIKRERKKGSKSIKSDKNKGREEE
jgi:hypothetical protein